MIHRFVAIIFLARSSSQVEISNFEMLDEENSRCLNMDVVRHCSKFEARIGCTFVAHMTIPLPGCSSRLRNALDPRLTDKKGLWSANTGYSDAGIGTGCHATHM